MEGYFNSHTNTDEQDYENETPFIKAFLHNMINVFSPH